MFLLFSVQILNTNTFPFISCKSILTWFFWKLVNLIVNILSYTVLCSKWTVIIMNFNNKAKTSEDILIHFGERAPSCGESVTLHQQRASRKYRLKKFLLSFRQLIHLLMSRGGRGRRWKLEPLPKKSSNGWNGRIKQAAVRATEPCSVWEKPVSSVPPSLWRRESHTSSGTTRPPPGRRSLEHRRLNTVLVWERTERREERQQQKKVSWSLLRRL